MDKLYLIYDMLACFTVLVGVLGVAMVFIALAPPAPGATMSEQAPATPSKERRAPRRMGYLSAKGFITNLLIAIESGYEVRIGDYGPDDQSYIELWAPKEGDPVSRASAGELDTLIAMALGRALEERGIIA